MMMFQLSQLKDGTKFTLHNQDITSNVEFKKGSYTTVVRSYDYACARSHMTRKFVPKWEGNLEVTICYPKVGGTFQMDKSWECQVPVLSNVQVEIS